MSTETIITADLGGGAVGYLDTVKGRVQIDGPVREAKLWWAWLLTGSKTPSPAPAPELQPRTVRSSPFWDWVRRKLQSRPGAAEKDSTFYRDPRLPYLTRYRLVRLAGLRVMLHEFHRGDVDPDLHDHPFSFVSLVLSGGYHEQTPKGLKWNPPGRLMFRRATHRHRVIIEHDRPCWTLVVGGPKVREWGFWTRCGWHPWREYVDRGGSICE